MRATREKISPRELAQRWGIDVRKVLHWINKGELRAINVAKDRHRRPQYRIDEKDIAELERIRDSAKSKPQRTSPRHRPHRLQLV